MARRKARRDASSSADDIPNNDATDASFSIGSESDTDLTDPDVDISHAGCSESSELLPRRYEDPPDDTDEDLSDVPSDYGGSDKTKKLKNRIEDRWQRYCMIRTSKPGADPKWSNPKDAIRQATANDVHRLLNWTLGKLKCGTDGRKLKGIKTTGALEADWKYFQSYYKRVTENSTSEKMNKAVHRGMRFLADKYGLNDQVRENTPVYIEDMVPFNETILQTQEKRFHLGIQRLFLCLYNMLGTFTVNRENALLNIQYKDLRLSMQRDPRGGPPIPNVDFDPRCIKQKFGMKKLNSFPLPEIIFGVSLAFSPHVFLFGFLFHADAFVNDFKSMADIRQLHPENGCQEMLLPLKPEVRDYYLFCKVDIVDGHVRLLRDTPMSAGTLDSQLKSASEIHGWLNPFYSHQFRHGGGKLLDESGFISDAQRNVIMNHATSGTFIKHYRTRRHHGLQEIMCGLDPDVELAKAMRRMSCSMDKRRPRYLGNEELAAVEQDPELQAAIRYRDKLVALHKSTKDSELAAMLDEQKREVGRARQRAQYRVRCAMRKEWSEKQAVIDIKRQLSGSAVNEGARQVLQKKYDMPAAQVHLLEKLLTWPTSDSLEDEWRRRNEPVEAVRQYCGFLEGGPLRGRPKRKMPPKEALHEDKPLKKIKLEEQSSISQWERKCKEIEMHIRSAPKPEACFQCRKEYTRYGDVLRHFRSAHLSDRQCNFCLLPLCDEKTLRRHAAEVHRLCT